ncbi:MAG: hypothetical protein GX103_06870 [Bacteroidales bacterium]|nr:hypothetical protein [Bacteroidales bacterium]
MALNQEIWRKYILDQLASSSEFLAHAYRVDEDNIVNGKIVHMPNAGADPVVTKNRSTLPATVVSRTDTDVVYLLDEFTTAPVNITDVEKVELSYNKIESVLGAHVRALREAIGDWTLFDWLTKNANTSANTPVAWTAGKYIASSGAVGVGNGPNSQSLAKLTSANLAAARLMMNKLNVPKENRFCLLPSIMYDELMAEFAISAVANIELLKSTNLPDGVLTRLYGFNIMERSSVALMTKATPTVVAPGTTEANTHAYAAVCWQKDMVESAIGEIKMFENVNDPTYYGDIYSALVRAGGRARWGDAKGVIPIVQAAVQAAT